MKSGKKVVVIGAGVAGLAASIRLAERYHVTVIENNDKPGGKLQEFYQDGFRYDAGPSLFTLPHLVDELFEKYGKNPSDYFSYQPLSTITRYFYEDKLIINAPASIDKLADEIELKTGEPAENIKKYLSKSRIKYENIEELFLKNSLHKLKPLFSSKALKALLKLPVYQLGKTMNQANEAAFTDQRVVQLFNRYATYNGSDPYKAPSMLTMIPHLEFNQGAYFPAGGMYTIIKALYKLALEVGVKFQFNTLAEQIIVKNNIVQGVQTSAGYFEADMVVSNMDVFYTYKRLLPLEKLSGKILHRERSSSAFVFYWNVNKNYPSLDLHNIFFSSNYQEEFQYLFDKKELYADPTVYINISSKYEPSDAPEGAENWFVMINVPSSINLNWENMVSACRNNIIAKINRILNEDIAKYISRESYLHPGKIEKNTFSHLGSLYGTSSNSKYAAFLRHSNFSRKIKNLYFCGGSVHPGGGIPLCLNSAKIVSDLILDYDKAR